MASIQRPVGPSSAKVLWIQNALFRISNLSRLKGQLSEFLISQLLTFFQNLNTFSTSKLPEIRGKKIIAGRSIWLNRFPDSADHLSFRVSRFS